MSEERRISHRIEDARVVSQIVFFWQIRLGTPKSPSGRASHRQLPSGNFPIPAAGFASRAAHRDHVWSDDFVEHRTHDGRKYRMLDVVDELSRSVP